MRPALRSSLTRRMLIALHILVGFRGEKRILYRVSSIFFRTPSIQPKQSASSTDWGQVRLGVPDFVLWKPTHNSVFLSWFFSSHRRHSAGSAKNRISISDRRAAQDRVAGELRRRVDGPLQLRQIQPPALREETHRIFPHHLVNLGLGKSTAPHEQRGLG